jgi:circadian clock protein KaiC
VLLSGTAGMGKTSFASALTRSVCRSGERTLYFAFEESPEQIVRNMRSIGIDLQPYLGRGLLRIIAQRPLLYGLDMHLVSMHKEIAQFRPSVVIVDPISNLIMGAGSSREVNSMVTLLIDALKTEGITAFLTVLTENGGRLEATDIGISSLVDVWMLVRDIESSGERNRGLYVLKARGMSHSNQIREYILSDKGINLVEVYLGPSGMLTGSARVALEKQERDASTRLAGEREVNLARLAQKRKAMEAQIEALRADFAAEAAETKRAIALGAQRGRKLMEDGAAMARSRRVDGSRKERAKSP